MKTISKLLVALLLVFTFYSCSKEPLADKNDQSTSTQADESMQKHGNTASISYKIDKAFLIACAQDCQLEILLGNLAKSNGSNPDVISYGQKMVLDHTQELADITPLAQAYGQKLPKGIHGTQHQTLHNLSSLHGNDFDIEYMKYNLSHHQGDIAAANYEVNNGNDQNIINYVNDTMLPMHYDHYGYATQIAQQLGIIP